MKKINGLKWVRRLIAAVSLTGMTTLFVAPTVGWAQGFGWLPRVQLVPAVAAGAFAVVAAILLVTLLVGRVYCSVVCPLGIVQDLFRAVTTFAPFRKRPPLPRPLKVSPRTLWIVRLVFLAVFAAGFFGGMVLFLAPYGIFGRAATFIRPPEGGLTVRLAASAWGVFAVVLLTTFWRGRFWCNTICPVGTLLGLVSRFAVFRVRIDRAKCVNCNLCVRECKCGCISSDREKSVDASRCVACGNCLGACAHGALKFGVGRA